MGIYKTALDMVKTAEPALRAPTREDVESLIQWKESRGVKNPDQAVSVTATGRRDIGRYQQSLDAYREGMEHLGEWDSVDGRTSPDKAGMAFWGYTTRYGTEKRLGRKPKWQDIIRIHNGGPNGYKANGTMKYWDAINAEARRRGIDLDGEADFSSLPKPKAKSAKPARPARSGTALTPPKPAVAAKPAKPYVVKPGETLWSLWKGRKSSNEPWTAFKSRIVQANPGMNPDVLSPGQQIRGI